MAQGALPGFRDFYPPEYADRAFIMRAWREVARRYGFAEYDGPPLEPLDLYTRKSGEEIVGQLYNFTDKGGREVALRPEMTPTFARMVASRANALRKPVRWFSIPQLFRYERQQKGRLREHFQLNVDLVGEADVTADAEVLACAVQMLREFGLGPTEFVARVSDRDLWRARFVRQGVAESDLPRLFAIVDKMERTPPEVTVKKLESLSISTNIIDAIFAFARPMTIDEFLDGFGGGSTMLESTKRLHRYAGYLYNLGVYDFVRIDTRIVRGLAYYTGIVFELFDALGEFRAIAGGGRYDNLLKASGGPDLPAVGFGMGDVVLGDLLRSRGYMTVDTPGVDVWIAYADDQSFAGALKVAADIRELGISVEYSLNRPQLARQLKVAGSAGARYVIIVSPDDWRSGKVTFRNMLLGLQGTMVHTALLQELASRVHLGDRLRQDLWFLGDGNPAG
jgi:histidyl-tRNA synthetase